MESVLVGGQDARTPARNQTLKCSHWTMGWQLLQGFILPSPIGSCNNLPDTSNRIDMSRKSTGILIYTSHNFQPISVFQIKFHQMLKQAAILIKFAENEGESYKS